MTKNGSFAVKVTVDFEWTVGVPLVLSGAASLTMHTPKEEWLGATVNKGTVSWRHLSECSCERVKEKK